MEKKHAACPPPLRPLRKKMAAFATAWQAATPETCGHGEQSRYDTQGEVLIDLKGLCLLHDVSNLALNAGQKRCGFGEDVLLIGKN